jgi:hypothetical protein
MNWKGATSFVVAMTGLVSALGIRCDHMTPNGRLLSGFYSREVAADEQPDWLREYVDVAEKENPCDSLSP